MDMFAKARGAMLGGAVGDAIGELAFVHTGREPLLAEIAAVPVLRYTDDTAMALALAESLALNGGFEQDHVGRTFHRHYQAEPWRGYGEGPPRIFSMVESEGYTYTEAAQTLFSGVGSLGNGAAMRITPLAVFYRDSPDLDQVAYRSAEITHAHPVGLDGAAVQARAVALALTLSRQAFSAPVFLDMVLQTARTEIMRDKLKLLARMIDQQTAPEEAARGLGLSVSAHESVPFALYCFLRYPDDFRDCVLCAGLHGGDRDTMGAMAGAVSGAFLGVDNIPGSWRERLENAGRIESLTERLLTALQAGR